MNSTRLERYENGELILVTEIESPFIETPDWDTLLNSLRGTEIFAKAFSTSNVNGFTLLLNALTTLKNEDDLAFALSQVRLGLSEDFNSNEIIQINQLLEQSHLTLRIS